MSGPNQPEWLRLLGVPLKELACIAGATIRSGDKATTRGFRLLWLHCPHAEIAVKFDHANVGKSRF